MLLAAALLTPAAAALEPPRAGELQRYARNGTLARRETFARKLGNEKVASRLVKRLAMKLRAARLGVQYTPPLAWRGMPTTGTDRILVLCIDFSDYPAQTPLADIAAGVGGSGPGRSSSNYPYENLRQFYLRSSYGQLDLQPTVLGWYRPGYARASMAQTAGSRDSLIKAALKYYDDDVDYSQFDNDGDGRIDYLAVLWSGPDNGWGNFWWGYQTSWSGTPPTLDGVSPGTYSWQWEVPWSHGSPSGTFSPLVMIHETGHALGLPDYYDYQSKAEGDTVGPDGGVGGYDMMDAKGGDHNAFSKWLLDWISPSTVSWVTRTLTLTPSCLEGSGSAVVVMPGFGGGSTGSEFFLVQNRIRYSNTNDCRMPGSHGLQIWHVDARLNAAGTDFAYNDSYTVHKLLRLQEADGLEEIERDLDYMDAGDYYVAGETFGTSGTPNSQRYDGTDTGVVVDSIMDDHPDVTCRVVGGDDHAAPTSWCDQAILTGWYTSAPTFTFGAEDTGGSGLLQTEYRLDAGSWQAGTAVTVTDGVHTLEWRAVDNAENREDPHSATVTVDTAAPVTTADSPEGWQRNGQPVTFAASDATSGVALTQWRVGTDGDWQSGTAMPPRCWRHTPSGEHVVQYYSTDVAGLAEDVKQVTVRLDHTPPVTTTDAPTETATDPVTVHLTALDADSGVAATWCSLNGGDWEQATAVELPESQDPRTDEIAYYSVDAVGNAEPVRTVSVTHATLVGGEVVGVLPDWVR